MRLAKRKLGRDDDRPVPGFPHATVGELARQKLSDCPDSVLDVLEPMLISATKLQAAAARALDIAAQRSIRRALRERRDRRAQDQVFRQGELHQSAVAAPVSGSSGSSIQCGEQVIWGQPRERV